MISVYANSTSDDETQYCQELMYSLGIDIKIADPSAVTRSEFLYILMQIINLDDIGESQNVFSDVDANIYYSSAVDAALDLKIISPSDKFYPDEPLQYAHMCKMAVSALGYDYAAAAHGGYPTGYIYAANAVDLLDGVSSSDTISKDNVMIFLWNLLHANVNIVSGVVYSPEAVNIYTPIKNVLYVYHDVYYIEGVVTETENSGLYVPSSRCEKGFVTIGENTYKTNVACDYLLGKRVVSYIKETNTSDELVYIFAEENKDLKITYDSINKITSSDITYFDGQKEKKASYGLGVAVLYNGVAVENKSIDSLVTETSVIELTDNDGNGKYDVFRIEDFDVFYVESVDSEKKIILDKNNGVAYLDDSEMRLSVFDNGQPSSFDAIAQGDVLKVYRSFDGICVKIDICDVKSVSGLIDEIDIAERKLTINGNTYSYGGYFERNYANSIRLGKTGTFAVGSDNRVYALVSESDSAIQYGYFAGSSIQKGMISEYLVKIFSQKGEMNIYPLADKVRYNDVITSKENIGAKLFGEDGKGIPQIIRYNVSSDNEVTMIDTYDGVLNTISGDENEYDNLVMFNYPSNVYSTVGYIPSVRMFHPYFKVADSTAIFLVADDETLEENQRYRLDSSRAYINAYRFIPSDTLFAYNVTDTGIAGAIVIKTDGGGETLEYTSRSGIVFSVNRAVNANGEEGIAMVVYSGTNYVRYFIVDENVLRTMNSAANFEKPLISQGDYIRFNANDNNVISAVTVDFSLEDSNVNFKFDNHVADLSYYYGPVYAKEDGMVCMKPENIFGKEADILSHESRYTFPLSTTITIYDTQTKNIYEGKTSEIIPYLADEEKCSRILIRTTDGVVTNMVLYN